MLISNKIISCINKRPTSPESSFRGLCASKTLTQHDLFKARRFISQGVNIHEPSSNGRTPLSWAAGKGHVQLVELLVSMGAYIPKADSQGHNAIFWAIRGGHFDVAQYLISRHAPFLKNHNWSQTQSVRKPTNEKHLSEQKSKAYEQMADQMLQSIISSRGGSNGPLFDADKCFPDSVWGPTVQKQAHDGIYDQDYMCAASHVIPAIRAFQQFYPGVPIHVIDLGAGNGKFLAYFIEQLEALCPEAKATYFALERNQQLVAQCQGALLGKATVIQADLGSESFNPKDIVSKEGLNIVTAFGVLSKVVIGQNRFNYMMDKLRSSLPDGALFLTSIHEKSGGLATPDQLKQFGFKTFQKTGGLNPKIAVKYSLTYGIFEQPIPMAMEQGKVLRWLCAQKKQSASDIKSIGRILEQNVVDINKASSNGRTALSWAAGRGHVKAVELLKQHGADATVSDSRGHLPMYYATKGKHTEVVSFLES